MKYLILVLLMVLSGCGRPAAPPPAPLSIEEWKVLPVEHKYRPETYEYLKADNPTLATDEGWSAFERAVIRPSKREDHQR